MALRFRRRSARIYFVVPAPAHDGGLRARASAFLVVRVGSRPSSALRGNGVAVPPHGSTGRSAVPGAAGARRRRRCAEADDPRLAAGRLRVTVDGVDRKVPEAASRLAALLALRPEHFSRFLVAKTLRPDLGRADAARHPREALRRLRASTSPAIVESELETGGTGLPQRGAPPRSPQMGKSVGVPNPRVRRATFTRRSGESARSLESLPSSLAYRTTMRGGSRSTSASRMDTAA